VGERQIEGEGEGSDQWARSRLWVKAMVVFSGRGAEYLNLKLEQFNLDLKIEG
jgi:hypothetical protein